MYSQCPECLTRFRVTASALRSAHGTVRCGRCGIAFDALPQLTDRLGDDAAGTEQPTSRSFSGSAGASAADAGRQSGAADGSAPEFHFTADDIEQVFIDARDWQTRFGASASPGDRAGRMSQPGTAELQSLLQVAEDPDEDADDPNREQAGQAMWVHEPEAVEDITLEGERIQIEGFDGLEEDFLEREIENALAEQHRAETTGSRGDSLPDEHALPGGGDERPGGVPAAVPLEHVDVEFDDDLDATDQFAVVRDVPDSAYPEHDEVESAKPLSAAVATAARAAGDPDVAGEVSQPADRWPGNRWRRPAADDALEPITIDDHDARLADDFGEAVDGPGRRWAWGIGAVLLALALSAQVAHQNRQQLARDARVGPAVREIYSKLGLPLAPNWNLAAFELRQWGANDTALAPSGPMVVRASLKNGATFAQPMPLLRLEFEDRFGGTVARRDFEPADYLQDPAQATRLLAPGATTEAELVIVAATQEAVGYRLDVCLREESTGVRCAQAAGAASEPSRTSPQ